MGEGGQVPGTQGGHRRGGEVKVLGEKGESSMDQESNLCEGRNSCKGVPGRCCATDCPMPGAGEDLVSLVSFIRIYSHNMATFV